MKPRSSVRIANDLKYKPISLAPQKDIFYNSKMNIYLFYINFHKGPVTSILLISPMYCEKIDGFPGK